MKQIFKDLQNDHANLWRWADADETGMAMTLVMFIDLFLVGLVGMLIYTSYQLFHGVL